jgi:porphobilinogen synthase
MYKRYKKYRSNENLRDLVCNIQLSSKELVYPVFIIEKENTYEEIASLKNQYRYSIDKLDILISKLKKANINKVLLFGIPLEKDEVGSSAYDEQGIIQRAIRYLKDKMPSIFIISDVCLCEYTSHGHCGILENNTINNDLTLDYLNKIALSHVKAGVDMLAPSDMNDGRVQSIKQYLDNHNYHYIPIISYAAKFASSYYGPFREAALSAPSFGDRSYYQMDYKNDGLIIDEALNDIIEGADFIIVKPSLAYLDIVSKLKSKTNIPIAVFNVSGEYAMVKLAASQNLIDERAIVLENMYAYKRAGANIIITYHALDLGMWLNG